MPSLLELSGWEWSDDGQSGLGVVRIFGVSHHLEAIRVDGSVSTYDAHRITLAEQICDARPLDEVEIDGARYVFLMTPFAESREA